MPTSALQAVSFRSAPSARFIWYLCRVDAVDACSLIKDAGVAQNFPRRPGRPYSGRTGRATHILLWGYLRVIDPAGGGTGRVIAATGQLTGAHNLDAVKAALKITR